jgi:hypothetical protein
VEAIVKTHSELTVDIDISGLPHGFDETQAFATDFTRQIWWRKAV